MVLALPSLFWSSIGVAGSVQSVAMSVICYRGAEIEPFKTEEFWEIEVLLDGSKQINEAPVKSERDTGIS